MALGGFSPCPIPLGGTILDGWTAEQHARFAADLTACVQTAPFAVLAQLNLVGGGGSNLGAYMGQHGVGKAAAPTMTNIGLGDCRVTWSAGYTDEYGSSYSTNIKHAEAVYSTLFIDHLIITAEIESPQSVRVRAVTTAGAASGAIVTLVVW